MQAATTPWGEAQQGVQVAVGPCYSEHGYIDIPSYTF